jgi:uncharacterized protein
MVHIRVRAIQAILLLVVASHAWGDSSPSARAGFLDIHEAGLFAHLYLPSGSGPFPVVVVVGGSEGGFITADAFGQFLPSAGIAVLGLAYFGTPDLPPAIDRIPIEYFINAIDYIGRQPFIDAERIGLVGGSKGGELALLLGSIDRRLHAICAIVPSHVVWNSARAVDRASSSWTFHGQPLPFVPYKGPLTPESGRLADLFELSLQNERAVKAAVIEVEKINGPLLLISAAHDEIWPSKQMSDAVIGRLTEKGFSFPYHHSSYDTGHGFSKDLAPKVNGEIVEFFRTTLVKAREGQG